ncbi:MAG: methyltransferase [Clostridia bacterium]|nr:methyltransferase [Clostridia bacterium]
MTSKERLLAALNHKEGDRTPVDFGGTTVTGMHYSCVAALRDYYGLEKRTIKVYEPYQMLGLIEEDLKAALGLDVEGVGGRRNMFGIPNENWKEWKQDNGDIVLVAGDFNLTDDEEGNHYIHPLGDRSVAPSGKMPKGGLYFDAVSRQVPFDDIDDWNPDDNLEEFTYTSDEVLDEFAADIAAAAKTGRGVTVSFGGTALGDIALVPGLNLKNPKGIRDVAEWYMATATAPECVKYIFDKQTDVAIENLKRLNEKTGDKIDVAFVCGTDFGTQISTFCSADTFRNLYMPYYKKVNNWIHENTNWKTFKHSCGAVEPFVPLFIEAGFDILNPVQCSAVGMDPKLLKEKYGKDIVFWGGGIDTQHLLPFGKPEDVKNQIKERLEIFSKDGGYVFNAIHNVQAGTPTENLVAMFEALKER